MRIIKSVIISVVSLFLFSCDAQYEFSSIPCFVVIDNSTHLDATLAGCLNSLSPGMFCCISSTTASGVQYFAFADNQGNSSTSKYDAIDSKRTLTYGLNNGIIVGYGNSSYPATLYAYDRQCPNCSDPTSAIHKNYPLTMSTSGIASCAKCGRKYDMNNGGIVSSGDAGNKMYRYRVLSAGPNGILNVNN